MKIKRLDELVDGFFLLSDWEEKYRYIIDLGERLPEFDSALKTDANMVRGCTSRVWLISEIKKNRF